MITVQPADDGDSVATFTYRDPCGAFIASGEVSRGSHGLAISRLEFRGRSVTAGVLRSVPVGEILEQVRAAIAPRVTTSPPVRPIRSAKQSRRHGGGRTPLPDSLIADIALAYLEETAPGKANGASKRLAVRFGRPEETVRAWVSRARRDGWLAPGTKGRRGAEAGPRLLEISK